MTASPQLESPLDAVSRPTRRPPLGIGFLQPEEPETIPSPSPSSTPPLESPEDVGGWDSEGASPDSEPSESPAGTSSRGSTPVAEQKVASPLAGEGMRETFRNGVIIASHQAHKMLVKTQGQLEAGLYIADEQDAAAVGDPLARIAGRRDALGVVSPDTADLMAAMMGLAGYASKQIQRQQMAKNLDEQYARTHVAPSGDMGPQ